MSLEDWINFDWISPEQSSPMEIAGLFGLLDRSLADAQVEAISHDLRFTAAYTAALTAANIALRASGYRVRTGPGHHMHTAESLELTIQAPPDVIRKMRLFGKKRNTASYDMAGSVTQADLADILALATSLREKVAKWLVEKHPELAP